MKITPGFSYLSQIKSISLINTGILVPGVLFLVRILPLQLNSTRGTEVDNVEEYKNLGVQIDKKMDWIQTKRLCTRKVRAACIFLRTYFNVYRIHTADV